MASGNRNMRAQAAKITQNRIRYDYDLGVVIDGNTVRQSAEPDWEEPYEEPIPEPIPRRRGPQRVPDRRPEREPRREPQRQSKRRRQERALLHAQAFNLPSLIVVGACMAIAVASVMSYVGAKGELDNHIRNVKSLTSELSNDIQVNDAMYMDVEASIDYTEIYEYAINTLGMTFPSKSQVMWYQSTESEYVSQYESIPQE